MDKMRLKKNNINGGKDVGKGLLSKQEKNQAHLYRLRVYEEMGEYDKIIEFINENKNEILDRIKMRELLARVYKHKGETQKVIENLETLLAYIPENEEWINNYCAARVQNGDSRRKVLDELYLKNKYSKLIPIMIMKDLKSDDPEFRERLEKDFIKAVRKVSPTYFRELKFYYEDKKKKEIIEEVILSNLASLEENLRFAKSEEGITEFPTCLMYVYYLLGWHYLLNNDYEKALEFSHKCEDHTPTFLENAILQATIFKALYKYEQAASVLEKYYKLDKADRYIINKTSKYLLLNNQIVEADDLFKTVIMDQVTPEKTIHHLEKMWYEIEMGNAYIRQRKWGRGLRQFEFVKEHIGTIIDDQGEFLNYNLRKYSLNQFIDLRKFADFTIYQDERIVRGIGNYLQAGLSYLRNKEIEDHLINLATEGMKISEKNKYIKSLDKKGAEGSVKVPKDQVKQLDLHGEDLLTRFNLRDVFDIAFKLIPQKFEEKRLVYTAIFDYVHHIGNYLKSQLL